jgi:Flp pilus assembly protein TadD
MRSSNKAVRLLWLRPLLVVIAASVCLFSAYGQDRPDRTDQTNILRGIRAELRVTLRDASGGQVVAAPATVKLYRLGALADQQATRSGHVSFILPVLGDFTVAVAATGFKPEQRDVSVEVADVSEVDVNLTRDAASLESSAVPGRPVLAPKAQEAFNKGLEALGQNNTKEAEKRVAEAIKLAPGHPDVLYIQGVLFLRERKFPEAQEALEKATQIDPNHAQAFAALGMAFINEGKYDAAVPPLEKSAQLEPGNWETEWTLAQAYYRHEQFEQALKASQDALTKSNGKAPEIQLLVAESLVAVGRYEDSAQVLREYVKNHGDRPDAAKARRWLDRLRADGKIKG